LIFALYEKEEIMIEQGLLYTADHEWARVEKDIATVGITDHAQEMLGEITFVELPVVGKTIESRGELAVVESSKAASDVYSPVEGTVTEVNSQLDTKPEVINEDCYRAGWICKLTITDNKCLEKLMNAKQYEEYLKGL
jgi:glycine cleavage system H protein